jgi:hypothetical protein
MSCCVRKEIAMNSRLTRFRSGALFAALSAALLTPCFAAPPGTAPTGATFDLFTAAEADAWNTKGPAKPRGLNTQRSLTRPGEPDCHAIPTKAQLADTDPKINILAPALGKPLSAPIDIDLQFVPAESTAIRPETFRVCYVGLLTIDITQRITDHVSVSPTGIKVTGAQLPHGHHHLVMMIGDQQGHFGLQDAVFDIQ